MPPPCARVRTSMIQARHDGARDWNACADVDAAGSQPLPEAEASRLCAVVGG
jgi:hypothetical protein